MSTIDKRLRASVRMDAINGDSFERNVCEDQMLEAAKEIEDQRIELADRAVVIARLMGENEKLNNLLLKYITMVGEIEGTTFIGKDRPENFTEHEWQTLKLLNEYEGKA